MKAPKNIAYGESLTVEVMIDECKPVFAKRREIRTERDHMQ